MSKTAPKWAKQPHSKDFFVLSGISDYYESLLVAEGLKLYQEPPNIPTSMILIFLSPSYCHNNLLL